MNQAFFCNPTEASAYSACTCHSTGYNLTFQVTDKRHGLDGVAGVGEGLDDMILHDTDHTETCLVT